MPVCMQEAYLSCFRVPIGWLSTSVLQVLALLCAVIRAVCTSTSAA